MSLLTKYNTSNMDIFPNWMNFDRFDNFLFDPLVETALEQRPKNKYRWSETDDNYKVDIVMPGMTKKDIEVTFKNEMLSVKCTKEVSEKDKSFFGVKTEQVFNNFPRRIDSTSITAEMVDGVLTVVLPKQESEKSKSIDIK